ncbi:hypothetical protein DKX38_022217 [Salix brachista]|uniref:Uncharacterized protein n=1 Tax=Salix brachista TaxID=2182728 RepID=A0A5N5JZ16_9ROSI|nr:hypothetical protein DKX38_022217 [Salix brachista]
MTSPPALPPLKGPFFSLLLFHLFYSMYDVKGGQVLIFLGTDKEFSHASNGFCQSNCSQEGSEHYSRLVKLYTEEARKEPAIGIRCACLRWRWLTVSMIQDMWKGMVNTPGTRHKVLGSVRSRGTQAMALQGAGILVYSTAIGSEPQELNFHDH